MIVWMSTKDQGAYKALVKTPPVPSIDNIYVQDNLSFLAYYQDILVDRIYKIGGINYVEAFKLLMDYQLYKGEDTILKLAAFLLHKSDARGVEFDLTSLVSGGSKKNNGVETGASAAEITTIPNGTIKVANDAFAYNSTIKTVRFPDTMLVIGRKAFHSCANLSKATLPPSVVYVGQHAFSGCSLTDVVIPAELDVIMPHTFSGCKELSNLHINEGVTTIGEYAFMECPKLIKLDIPESVEAIHRGAFSLCHGLIDLNLGTVESIGDFAFYRCRALSEVTLPSTLSELGNEAFAECPNLKLIKVHDSLSSIPPHAFKGLPDDVHVVVYNSGNLSRTTLIARLKQYQIDYEVVKR